MCLNSDAYKFNAFRNKNDFVKESENFALLCEKGKKRKNTLNPSATYRGSRSP